MFDGGVGVPHTVKNHQKHAQTTYLDEYLWFKKNLKGKFLLNKKLENFYEIPKKKSNFFKKRNISGQWSFKEAPLRLTHKEQILWNHRSPSSVNGFQ